MLWDKGDRQVGSAAKTCGSNMGETFRNVRSPANKMDAHGVAEHTHVRNVALHATRTGGDAVSWDTLNCCAEAKLLNN